MVAILATYSYIKYASIPLIIKQIDKAKKQIKGNKSVSDDRMTITKNDEIMELFEDDWKLLDIDLGTLLKTDEGIPNESITSGDEPVGGVL